MRISEQGQITIPDHLRVLYGLDDDVEVEIEASPDGILIRKCGDTRDPFERVAGIIDRLGGPAYPMDDVDAYIDEIRRGR